MSTQIEISGIELTFTIFKGRNLVAKDRNFLNQKTTSDVSSSAAIFGFENSHSNHYESLPCKLSLSEYSLMSKSVLMVRSTVKPKSFTKP